MSENHLAAPTLSQKPVVQVNLLDHISKRGPSRKPENWHSKHLSHWRWMQPKYAACYVPRATPFNKFLRKVGCRCIWDLANFRCSLPETSHIDIILASEIGHSCITPTGALFHSLRSKTENKEKQRNEGYYWMK